MAGKKKAKKKAAAKPEVETVTVGKGEKVEAEVAIKEVANIKVRSVKLGVRMMTPSEFSAYCEDRDKKVEK
jgi:hypothetical protein